MAFQDTASGQVIATTLHTAGAILYLGGLAAFWTWYRHLRSGRHVPNILAGAAASTYVALLANLVGGFMRTYQEGHPRIQLIASEPWVQVLTVKHVFLFAGIIATVLLFEWAAPRLIRAHRKRDDGPHGAVRWMMVLSIVGVAVASLLGAFSQVIPLDAGMAEPAPEVVYHNATGQLTSTAAAPTEASGSFIVPSGTLHLEATLVWAPDAFALLLGLEGPDGPVEATGSGRAGISVTAPAPGTWSYTISSDLALAVTWEFVARMQPLHGEEMFIAEEVVIPPGSFFEINTEMPEGATFSWQWETTGVVLFDVHSHFDDEVQVWVEERTDAHEGTFTNERQGGYSLLWANEGQVPITLDYRVWGDFEVDSYFPPR